MATPVLKRQFITDETGNPVGVILPMEEFALVEEALRQHVSVPSTADKLAHLEQAAEDPLFMSDLRETMEAFSSIDAQGWDPAS